MCGWLYTSRIWRVTIRRVRNRIWCDDILYIVLCVHTGFELIIHKNIPWECQGHCI
jgi:hypothetical protein